jgi:hypothetical protein
MDKVMVRLHNSETGQVIDREATADELAQMAADAEARQLAEAAKESQEASKQALLERLGITADEAKLLLS